jgi:hypothetical protein
MGSTPWQATGSQLDGTNTRLRLGIAECTEVLIELPTIFIA